MELKNEIEVIVTEGAFKGEHGIIIGKFTAVELYLVKLFLRTVIKYIKGYDFMFDEHHIWQTTNITIECSKRQIRIAKNSEYKFLDANELELKLLES